MKPVLFACLAVLFYALGNVITEQKLKPFTEFGTILYCCIPMVGFSLVALGWMRLRQEPIVLPTGNALYFAGMIAIVFFLADTFFFKAYTHNADSMTVATIALMMPAFTSLMKYLWTGQTPNRYHMAAYAVAIVAVVLAERGSQLEVNVIDR
jgi:drug/metabolite transporter (DMT)-like permease